MEVDDIQEMTISSFKRILESESKEDCRYRVEGVGLWEG